MYIYRCGRSGSVYYLLGIMKNLISFLLALFASAAVAATNEVPDDTVVKEMARQTNMSAKEIRENFNACDSGHTVSMMVCLRYNWIAEDIELNRIYKLARAQAREIGYEASLIKAQRAWITFRDAECNFEGELRAGGGREQGIHMLICMAKETSLRAGYLKARLN